MHSLILMRVMTPFSSNDRGFFKGPCFVVFAPRFRDLPRMCCKDSKHLKDNYRSLFVLFVEPVNCRCTQRRLQATHLCYDFRLFVGLVGVAINSVPCGVRARQ